MCNGEGILENSIFMYKHLEYTKCVKNIRNGIFLTVFLEEGRSSDRQKAAVVILVAATVVFSGGYIVFEKDSSACPLTEDAMTEKEIWSQAQSVIAQRLEQQRQHIAEVANRNEGLAARDMGVDAAVTNVEASKFPGLYRVTVHMQGKVPGPTGQIKQMDENQVMYISQDGKYLFPEPTPLKQSG